ncbi:MFS transporter [Actinophytocola sp.]|uniref:MFS transporter n=1 Tax=Actinophytocola sp. TaxID=1872138 RepID=UPI002ED1B63D
MTATVRPGRNGVALGVLAVGMFTAGTAELVVVGILSLIADDLSVSVSTAGLLVTSYALGLSLGAPLITALTIRFSRRFMLALSLAVYLAGNAMAAVAVSFGLLMVARVIMGSVHGLFIGLAFTVAAALAPAGQQGRAMAIAFGGTAVSTVLGVPLGTLIGQAMGWRAAFFAIAILGVVALAMTLLFIPAVRTSGTSDVRAQVRAAFVPRVLVMLGVGLLLIGGEFTAFTYIAPYLEEITGISGSLISVFLFAYGLFCAVGVFSGGWFADRGATKTLIFANVVLILSIGGLYLLGASPVLAAVMLAAWGLVSMGLVPSLQLRVISLAGEGGDLAATLGASAVNAGIAAGAILGGVFVDSYGVESVLLAAMVMCLVGLPLTILSGRLRPPTPTPAESAPAGQDSQELAERGSR